jgi:two-component system sensor histidine kinase ChvG
MVSATVTEKCDRADILMTNNGRKRSSHRQQGQRSISPITARILGVNLFALLILVGGLLYLGEYRRGLVAAESQALKIQSGMIAAAVGESGINAVDADGQKIDLDRVRPIVRRLSHTTGTRTRLFSPDGNLLVDSRSLPGPAGVVLVETLPLSAPQPSHFDRAAQRAIDAYLGLTNWLPGGEDYPSYQEGPIQHAGDYPEVAQALTGDSAGNVRRLGRGNTLLLTAAAPVPRYKQVLAAVLLARDSHEIDAAVLGVRLDILAVFAVSLCITILLSLYLAGTIARPLRRLAEAAKQVRHGTNRQFAIPVFAKRHDEIADLAEALSEMTEALWQRMDAIEAFAADVAHEIKNPLTSLRSAVETAARLDDPAAQQRLMAVILDDVDRLDRLLSSISDASRLDAELSRMDQAPVNLVAMLETLVNLHNATAETETETEAKAPQLVLKPPAEQPLIVQGMEERLAQVLRNLIANARSFSPPGGTIDLSAQRDGDWVLVKVEDEGPGIPAGKEEAIFERFYSERPAGEKVSTHSGLGLSISRQIVEAHGGTITATNRFAADGSVKGTCFTVSLTGVASLPQVDQFL